MAAFSYDDFDDTGQPGTVQAIINWGGAFLSVLLIAGLAVWGWKLWQRDVTGIPVVRALEGPMRVAPADPGGIASEYQGLAVNRIAEERGEERVEQVVLAPAPAELPEEDNVAMIAPSPAPDALPSIEVDEASAFAAESVSAPVEDDGPAPSATDLAVAAALADLGLDSEETATAKPLLVAFGVPASTPRPLGRPEGVRLASLSPTVVTGAGEVDAATIAPGTRLVQLGAYGSPEIARAEWDNAMASFGDYMVGKDRVIQEAETGGRTFWRLRAIGFDGLSDARRFCAVLVADGANCIPVVQE
ncbi:SPOR domain-containing protein [Alphaproteobacteria bacterium GH1-50]|uniref:SPOR domain-containing protein n=1 Tax=Kangsaoukella pontilimi TaxID=2691042 RepID=A0A7C9MYX4_9RHOB|nr:SPOR domain-containing protein [Kangsaoukella pontilimi]MXQ07078.1 SPOR domain-containing protein [Kangsaoukella pontilimi]